MKRLALSLLAATPFLSALVPQADGAAVTSHTPSFNPRQYRAGLVKRRFNYGVASPAAPVAATPVLDPLFGGTLQLVSRSAPDAGVANLDDGIIRSRDGTLLVPGTSSAAGLIVVNQTIGGTLDFNTGATIKTGTGTLTLGTVNTNGSISVIDSVLSGNSGTLTINGSSYSTSQTLSNLTIADGGSITISSQPPIAPGAAPVPEPGSALLLALGTLAVSMVRRRTI